MNQDEEDNILYEYVPSAEETQSKPNRGLAAQDPIEAEAAEYAKQIADLENGAANADLIDPEDFLDEDDYEDGYEDEDEEVDLDDDGEAEASDDFKLKVAKNPWRGFIKGVRAAFKLWDAFQFAVTQDYKNKQKATDFVDIIIEMFQQYST